VFLPFSADGLADVSLGWQPQPIQRTVGLPVSQYVTLTTLPGAWDRALSWFPDPR
jgi:hypothetical protein